MRNEQFIQPLDLTIVRPLDGNLPKKIWFVKDTPDGNRELTPYFSSDGLSFATMQKLHDELGLAPIKNEVDLAKELESVVGPNNMPQPTG